MMRIERSYNGFSIRLMGDRRKYTAMSSGALLSAVAHYFGERTPMAEGQHRADICPLCEAILYDEKKKNGGKKS